MSVSRWSALVPVLLTGAASAAGLGDCVRLEDPVRRLACYDHAAGRSTGRSPALPTSDFGRDAEPAPPVERLEARIRGDFRRWKKGTRLTLDNGQAWKVTGDDEGYYPKLPRDPAVIIRPGLFGSYWMELKDVGRRVKVARVD